MNHAKQDLQQTGLDLEQKGFLLADLISESTSLIPSDELAQIQQQVIDLEIRRDQIQASITDIQQKLSSNFSIFQELNREQRLLLSGNHNNFANQSRSPDDDMAIKLRAIDDEIGLHPPAASVAIAIPVDDLTTSTV